MEYVKIELEGKILTINIIDKDEEFYRFLKEIVEGKKAERFVNALRLGILGLRRMDVGGEMDYVEKEFNTLLYKFQRLLDPAIETSHLGKLSVLLKDYFGKGGKVETILDPMNGDTPLAILRKEITKEIRELRDEIIKKEAKQEIINSTTLKGYDFEDTCEEILSEIVRGHMGDELERKTSERGQINGSYAGDFLITLKDRQNKKIVFEIKDIDNISQPMIIDNLERAMKNRGASYAVFVTKYREALPMKIGWFNEFRGNMLVIALGGKEENIFFPELLNVAYEWARLRLTMEVSTDKKAIAIVDEGVKQISEKLEIFSQIQRQCTNAEKAIDEIRKHTDDLKGELEEQIQRIRKALSEVPQ